MSFLSIFFILVLSLGYFELLLLVEVSSEFGFLTTLLLCFFTAIVGGGLVKSEGLSVLADLQRKISRGEDPSKTVVGAVVLFTSGVLLLVPGFITDIFGFLCLFRPFRESVGGYLFSKVKGKIFNVRGNQRGAGGSSFYYYSNIKVDRDEFKKFNETNNPGARDNPDANIQDTSEDNVIDVKFEDKSN